MLLPSTLLNTYELMSPLTIFASGFRKKSEVLENNLWLVGHCASHARDSV